jgi:hypothetical protein
MSEIRALIVRMATENRGWGYTRIQGALANLHHEVSRGTIATVVRDHGLEPAPDRLTKTTWTEFLKAQWDVLAAADFFTVDLWTSRGLKRFTVLFLIDLSTRHIHIAGITPEPDGAWMTRISRNLTDVGDGHSHRGRRARPSVLRPALSQPVFPLLEHRLGQRRIGATEGPAHPVGVEPYLVMVRHKWPLLRRIELHN